jgi:hypothetical protein
MVKTVCDSGCGREAINQLKDGRLLCAEHVAQCPAMRAKNNPLRRGQDPFAGRAHTRGMAGKVAWNRGKTWDAMYSPQVVESQRRRSATWIKAVGEALASAPEREQARRAKLSIVAKERGLGGYERGWAEVRRAGTAAIGATAPTSSRSSSGRSITKSHLNAISNSSRTSTRATSCTGCLTFY